MTLLTHPSSTPHPFAPASALEPGPARKPLYTPAPAARDLPTLSRENLKGERGFWPGLLSLFLVTAGSPGAESIEWLETSPTKKLRASPAQERALHRLSLEQGQFQIKTLGLEATVYRVEMEESVTSVETLLSETRALLGVSKSTLATLLGVTRPTLYSWSQNAQPQARHREALEELHRRASRWSEHCEYPPAALLTARRVGGKTLAEWLSDPQTDEAQLDQAMRGLAPYVLQAVRVNEVSRRGIEDGLAAELLDR